MRYIGKICLRENLHMTKIADRLGLEDIVLFKTDDLVGMMNWRGVNKLVLLHLSSGEIDKAEKVRVYVHHLEDEEVDEFFKLMMKRFRSVAVEVMMNPIEIEKKIQREIQKEIEKDSE